MSSTRSVLEIDGHGLRPADVLRVISGEVDEVRLADAARERVVAARGVIERAIAEGRTIYGVNTGFGKLADQRIPLDRIRELQRNLLLSHSCGVGEPLPDVIVGLALLFRANALSLGRSGCRPVVIETGAPSL